jgi:GH15 family glucan-1,4-alpha-glucosidase
MPYLPIEQYGIIGDLHTAALVSAEGSIDWLCFPHFDSPSVFAALLDDKKGGCFQIHSVNDDVRAKQLYLPDTNILITRFLKSDGIAEITDFMPIENEQEEHWKHRLIRRVQVIQGTWHFSMLCQPAFDYARAEHTAEQQESGVAFHSQGMSLGLVSQAPMSVRDNAAVSEFTLESGQSITFLLYRMKSGEVCSKALRDGETDELFSETSKFWRDWVGQCTYHGRWREMVQRSALVLKLLTFAPTGAIVAAPTTSLPEQISGRLNWDYRYSWIRDASFTCYALLRLGFETETRRFMTWLEARCNELEEGVGLQVMYTIDGKPVQQEQTLHHLSGYRNSHPVRVGNNAHNQLQLDIYGELLDAVYLFNKYDEIISYDQWSAMRKILGWLCNNWQQPDQGIWEIRGERREYVHSRMMVWVALDRGLRVARQRGLPADIALWEDTRNKVYEEVIKKGWNTQHNAFVQSYSSDTLDAANLLMPLVKFLGPNDPRMLSTLDKILDELTYDSLVYRYRSTTEGSFTACSFWLVECLTRANRLDEARLKLEKTFSYANHLGLFAEETGFSGEMRGNYPQALTHLALISATTNLARRLGEE